MIQLGSLKWGALCGLLILFGLGLGFALVPEYFAVDHCLINCWMTTKEVPRLASIGSSLTSSSLIGAIVLMNEIRREAVDERRSRIRALGYQRSQMLDRLILELHESARSVAKKKGIVEGKAMATAEWVPSDRFQKSMAEETRSVLTDVENYRKACRVEIRGSGSLSADSCKMGADLFDKVIRLLIDDYDKAIGEAVYGRKNAS